MHNDDAFPKPRFSKTLYCISRCIMPSYLYWGAGVRKTRVVGKDVLKAEIDAFKQQQQCLIIAFRHTAKEDAPALLFAVKESHLRFLYGRDVLNWAGRTTRFLFPRLGFVAVQNRTTNKEGIALLKHEIQYGRFPLALAPEGQVTYHRYRTDAVQMGVANLAFWARETNKEVTILPVAIGYRYAKNLTAYNVALVKRFEKATALTLEQKTMPEMVIEALQKSLKLVASFFNLELDDTLPFIQQRDQLCKSILSQGEAICGIKTGDGSILDRLFRLRFAGEDLLYGEKNHLETPLDEAQKRYNHKKAHLFLHNSQVVDLLEYLDPSYLQGADTQNRICETLINLLDLVNRLQGGSINTRFSPRRKQATLVVGKPLRVGNRTAVQGSRKQQLQTIRTLTKEALQETSEALEHHIMNVSG